MESKKEHSLGPLPASVFELPGEPAIVINGLPPLRSTIGDVTPLAPTDAQQQMQAVFGEWLIGREVQKKFGRKFFNGQVTQYDKEMGWYTVVYEDGDTEELEWLELEKVLVPLDVNIPLNTLAMKVIKGKQKSIQPPAKHEVRTNKSGVYSGKGN